MAGPLETVTVEDTLKILWIVVILAFMIERALALVFEHRVWIRARERFNLYGCKEVIAFALAWGLCRAFEFDAVALLFGRSVHWLTLVLTAMIVAGGSKGAIRLMQGALKVRRPAIEEPAKGGKR